MSYLPLSASKMFLQWEAGNNQPPASNFATLDTRNSRNILRFDATTQETAVFAGIMPSNYLGGNITVDVYWAADTATTGTIGWDATFERVLAGTDDTDSDGWATAQTITAPTVSGTAGVVSKTSVTCTAGATGTDSIVAGDMFRLRIRRDVANDTATGDAQIFHVVIKEA